MTKQQRPPPTAPSLDTMRELYGRRRDTPPHARGEAIGTRPKNKKETLDDELR